MFIPIAAIAITIRNLLSVFKGSNRSAFTPQLTAIVVIIDAPIKNSMKNGKIFLMFILPALFDFCFFALAKASTRVIGIIASVLVILTVTALSSVAVPRLNIPSHVEAVAVTDDISFTAVPAKIPKASPEVVSNPISCPNEGNKSAASTLNRKITDIDCATSSSSASITGAVAAIAEPPHIEEPTPIRVATFAGIFINLLIRNAIISDMPIVHIIMGSDCLPVSSTTFKSMPKPSSITAH